MRSLVLVLPLVLAGCAGGLFGNDVSSDSDIAAATVPGPALPAPAPAAPAPGTPAFFQSVVGDRVLFEVDQATLTPTARGVLNRQAEWLTTNSDYQAVIEGHADEQGTTEYNIALSARRANAVREYLVSQGIPSTRLRTLPYGKERPAELCAEERCYAANRRAVTVITGSAPLS
ncbi:MAG: OmpA family protein [Shimia sp.]